MPPNAPAMPPIPTTEATALAGNMSDGNVSRFDDHPWCAAVANPISITAPHVDATLGANTIGITAKAQINIAVLRLRLADCPRRINDEENHPPAMLPASAIT